MPRRLTCARTWALAALALVLVLAGCGSRTAAAPSASGAFNMMRQLGGVFGIAILVAVFSGDGGYASPQLFSDGFTAAIGAAAALSLLGAMASLGLPGSQALTYKLDPARRSPGPQRPEPAPPMG